MKSYPAAKAESKGEEERGRERGGGEKRGRGERETHATQCNMPSTPTYICFFIFILVILSTHSSNATKDQKYIKEEDDEWNGKYYINLGYSKLKEASYGVFKQVVATTNKGIITHVLHLFSSMHIYHQRKKIKEKKKEEE